MNAAGFSLIEVTIASALVATLCGGAAQLLSLSVRTNTASRVETTAAVLAQQKIEVLRTLAWTVDVDGVERIDTASDTTVHPEAAAGGTGLQDSSPDTLDADTAGWVDYLDAAGRVLGGGPPAPAGVIYVRRWSVQALPAPVSDVRVLQVRVVRRAAAGGRRWSPTAPEAAYVATARTRGIE